ncbi:MAG TPA: phosphate acyltransferase PlsX [Abditibacteriaceae bacterium]|nr:phosphate acyltransferase PlsX [Abditibacteriaceae bacterium]
MRIAIDAMGGDQAPAEVVAGAVAAAHDFGIEVILVGDAAALKRCLPAGMPSAVTIHATSQIVEMDEAPAQALRAKKDSSLAVAIRLHAEGRADAVLSAGNTGATAAFALFTLKRIPGIDRPGIATVFPTTGSPLVLLDAGANVDCRPHHLAEFAVMGAAYARTVQGIIPGTKHAHFDKVKQPKVGLLSIGEEASKGNDLTKAAYKLLQEKAPHANYEFYGNVEGRDIGRGTVDVVVCDGFVGNVVLKVAEGFAKMFAGALREAVTATWRAKAGAVLLRPSLRGFKKRIDYTEYGGAVLLGVNGVCIICHGSSNARAIYSAIRIARQTVATDIVGTIRKSLESVSDAAFDGASGADSVFFPTTPSGLNNGQPVAPGTNENGATGSPPG